MDLAATAQGNFHRHLRDNRYPGRGLVLGRAADGDAWIQLYWIMGRSENSRNRRFVVAGTTLRTEPIDVTTVADPELIIYEAMRELPDVYVVTNGDHTRTIVDSIGGGGDFEEALASREREDDPPHYTSRIGGVIDLRGRPHGVAPRIALSILRANEAALGLTDRTTFRPALPPPGYGLCLTTYQSDGAPLPSFRGDPLWLPLDGNVESVLATYWAALDAENRIALALKRIPVEGGPGQILVRNSRDE